MIPRQLLAVVGGAAQPLEAALDGTDVLEGILADVGVVVGLTDDQRDAIAGLAGLNAFAGIGELVATAIAGEPLDLAATARLTDAVVTAVDGFATLASGADVSSLPSPLDDSSTWASVVDRLPDALLSRAIEGLLPTLSAALAAVRVLRVDEGSDGLPGRRWIDWPLLVELLGGDWRGVPAAYRWGDGFDAGAALDVLADVAGRAGIRFHRDNLDIEVARDRYASCDPALRQLELSVFNGSTGEVAGRVGAAVVPVPAIDGDRLMPTGFLILNRSTVEGTVTIDLGDTWRLELSGDLAAIALPSVELQPGAPPALTQGATTATVSTALVGSPASGQPWLLIGERDGIRVELAAARLEATATLGTSRQTTIAAELTGLRLVTDSGAADNFVATVIGALPIDVGGDVALEWSSTGALTFRGSTGLAIPIGGDVTLGPLRISGVQLVLDLDGGITIVATGTVTVTIASVFEASIVGLGLAVRVTVDPDGSGGDAGGVTVTVDFEPPFRVEFTLDTEAARGGGFVEVDPEIGRYSGALSLDFLSIGIDAIVVVDTQLPGDPDGWALFASLAASFPGIPLGFGFTLNGVGGLIALNRTMDAEALAGALRSGVIDDLLFPDDPLGDSAELIAKIDDYFPLLDGNTVIGPVIEIGWGTPTLITAQLGVVLSLPDGVIAVLGSVEALLPTPDAPLITLHMDSLGVIDIGAGTFSLTASLYDSKLLGTIDLSGDMAMYLQVTGQPYFLLSVGGFHPGFEPPSIVPSAMHDLRRMRAAISVAANVSISVEAYFAVTSNSLQFGAGVYVIASVEIWPATYTAKGWFAFDVLLVFSPFKIVASMSAGVGIYSGNKELMGVQLSLQLEGPKPWYAVGNASFKFFGIKVDFELEVGSTAAGEPKPIANPLTAVLDALGRPSSWSETAPVDGLEAGITYAPATPEDETVWVRPDHQLTVRQSVAPLNRTLEIVGQAVPAAGEELLTVTGAALGGEDTIGWELADDWFAPAQFEVLGKTDKLTRASYEPMTAGVTFGAPGVDVPKRAFNTELTVVYEEETWEPDEQPWTLDPTVDSLAHSVLTGAAGAGLRHRGAQTTSPRFTIAPTAYTLVRSADGTPAADVLTEAGLPLGGVSQHAAMQARNAAVAGGEAAAELVLVPVSTAMEPS